MTPLKYVEKTPCSVEAIEWSGDRADLKELWAFCPRGAWVGSGVHAHLRVPTLRGEEQVEMGWFIVKGSHGHYSVLTPGQFEDIYQKAKE